MPVRLLTALVSLPEDFLYERTTDQGSWELPQPPPRHSPLPVIQWERGG